MKIVSKTISNILKILSERERKRANIGGEEGNYDENIVSGFWDL